MSLSNAKPILRQAASIAILCFCCPVLAACGEGVITCEGPGCSPPGDAIAEGEAAGPAGEAGPETDARADESAAEDVPVEEPVAPPPVYSFVVFGDNQFATESCTSGVPERLAIPKVILDLAPTFFLHTGDLMDHGYEDGAYDAFVGCYGDLLAAIPFFPTTGNHDMGSGGILNYKAYLEDQIFGRNPSVYGAAYDSDFQVAYEDDTTDYCDSPSSRCMVDVVPSGFTYKTFYAYKTRNAYFLSFEQGTRWWTDTPIPWVENHLAAARADPDVRHVFVHMHHPMYSTTMAESSPGGECIDFVREHYEELFRRYDVTIVFSGHAHVYDRFYVPDDGAATRARPSPPTYPHDGQGVHYIVTGGGGGPLPSPCPPGEREELSYDYSQNRGCGYHVTLVEVDGDALTVSIIGVEGRSTDFSTSVWDTFTIEP